VLVNNVGASISGGAVRVEVREFAPSLVNQAEGDVAMAIGVDMAGKDKHESDSPKGAAVIDLAVARQTHDFQRKEGRVKAMRETFKAVREAHQEKPGKPNKRGRKKKK